MADGAFAERLNEQIASERATTPCASRRTWRARPLARGRTRPRPPPPAARSSEPLGNVSYHVKVLADAGAFEEPKVHISWTRLELDAEAYAELAVELEA